MTFSGIPIEALDFYEGLEADNTRTYWNQHKDTYDTVVRASMTALAEKLAPEFGDLHVYRPYRDLRFSRDKTPYKDHQGVIVGDYYVQVSAAGLFVAAGYYRMSPDQVARYREAVDDAPSGDDLVEVVDGIRSGGYEVGGDRLKTKPRGFDADHPRIELLRHRTLVAWTSFGAPDWLDTPAAAEHVATAWRELSPLQRWLDEHVGAPRIPDPVR